MISDWKKEQLERLLSWTVLTVSFWRRYRGKRPFVHSGAVAAASLERSIAAAPHKR